MNDPNKWQPLQFPRGQAEGQGGRPAPDIQTFIGAQWGFVTPFALPRINRRRSHRSRPTTGAGQGPDSR